MDSWKGKVAVVTGSSSGIGAAISKSLSLKGVKVVGLARRLDRLEKLKQEIQAEDKDALFYSVKCDLTRESEIKTSFDYVIKSFGGIDILINNAGVYESTSVLAEDNLDQLKTVIDTNFIALVSCTKKAFQSMSDRDVPGYIINIASTLSYYTPAIGEDPLTNLYAPSKFAVRALNTVLRHELNYLKKNKIRISNISPGLVKTEMTDDGVLRGLPGLQAEDVADLVLYVLGTNGRVQVEDVIIRPTGEIF